MKFLSLLKLGGSKFLGFMTGWKLYATIALVCLATGTAAGIRWEKGAQAADLEAELRANAEQYEENLAENNRRWEAELAIAQGEIDSWATQAARDEETIRDLIDAQDVLRRQFDEIDTEITVVEDFGTCTFSADAVGLLRAASEAATAAGMPGG